LIDLILEFYYYFNYGPLAGSVAQWLGRRSLAGGLSLICA